MTLSAVTNTLFAEAQRAIETLDRARADEVQQVLAALRTANRDRLQALSDVRRQREEAARLISESIDDAERAEAEFAAALDRIERGLAAIAPAPVEARPKPRAIANKLAAE